VSATPLSPTEVRFPLRPGRGAVVLHATGFRHPRSRWTRAEQFTAYGDVTHVQLGSRFLRLGTRQGVWILPRALFAEPEAGPEAVVRALIERIAAEPGGAAQLARMAQVEELMRHPPRLRATPAVTALCVVAYALQLWLGPAVAHVGLMSPWLVTHGEPWRLLTANLLHADLAHLILNMLGLMVLGALVERPLGATRTVFVLGLSGLASSASAWVFGYDGLLGASGMVAGLAGAMLWLDYRRPEGLPAGWRLPRRPFIAALLADAVLPLVLPFVAGGAHLLGFLAGGGAAASATPPYLRREPVRAAVGLASLLVGLAAIGSLASAGRFLLDPGAWEAHAKVLLAAEPPSPVLLNDAAWLIATGHEPTARALDEALEMAQRAVRATGHRDPNLLDTLAETQFRSGNRQAALATIDEAIALAPDEPYFREQRRRFSGKRAADDRPAPPHGPEHVRPPRHDREPAPSPWDDTEPGIAI
jgi:membrane associated rhomboid family serine protease